jgi:hypothetical protein
MSRIITCIASLWFIAGCSVQDDPEYASDAVISLNGIDPNGIDPNGIDPNGIDPNGIDPNGVSLNGIDPNGISVNGRPLGVAITGSPLAGADLVGSMWTGRLSSGGTVALRIDEAVQGTGSNTDLWMYRFSVSAGGTWRPLCRPYNGAPNVADSVQGTWNLAQGVPGGGSYDPDASQFTLACRGSSIAKCVELGYKPWTGNARELAACVRALRADYCGDGTPYTVTGTLVNLFDDQGIQPDGVAWVPEAEWTPDGATCVSKKKQTRFDQVLGQKPTCYPHALKPEKSCGTGFESGATIITELAPR